MSTIDPRWILADVPVEFVCPRVYEEIASLSPSPGAARTSKWMQTAGGTPVRISVVSPYSGLGMADFRAWLHVFTLVVSRIDELFNGDGVPRPASIDAVVYLGGAKKAMAADGGDAALTPSSCNSGVTTRDMGTGGARVLVYRKEESVKTLIHEVMHAYGFGDWADADAEVLNACRGLADAMGVRVISERGLFPSEALVDAMAIRISVDLFGGATWDECVSHATRLRDKLVSWCASRCQGRWLQTTPAFEYYCVKPTIMKNLHAVRSAHKESAFKPDKSAIRKVFADDSPRPRPSARLGAFMHMRMTPASLAPPPQSYT